MTAEGRSDRLRSVDHRTLFRDAAHEIARASDGGDAPEAEFFCECGESRCTERMRLTLAEYEAIRAMPGRFLVLPGHEDAPFRRVVSSNDRFSVVVELARAVGDGAAPRYAAN